MLNKFSTARVVVSRFLGSLDQRTSFALIASGEAAEAVSDSLVPASQDNVSKAEAFIEDKITPKGDDGRLTEAFQKAVALKPQRIVFVTDGDFLSGPVVEKVRASNVPITVAIIRTAYDGVGDTTAAEHLSGVTPGGLVMHIRDE